MVNVKNLAYQNIDYRKEAKGRECQIREPGICNWDVSTTVLCHKGGAGMALKENDKIAAWGCSSCHAWIDGGYTQTGHTREYAENAHSEGIFRTQRILIKEGKL